MKEQPRFSSVYELNGYTPLPKIRRQEGKQFNTVEFLSELVTREEDAREKGKVAVDRLRQIFSLLELNTLLENASMKMLTSEQKSSRPVYLEGLSYFDTEFKTDISDKPDSIVKQASYGSILATVDTSTLFHERGDLDYVGMFMYGVVIGVNDTNYPNTNYVYLWHGELPYETAINKKRVPLEDFISQQVTGFAFANKKSLMYKLFLPKAGKTLVPYSKPDQFSGVKESIREGIQSFKKKH